MPKKYHAKPGYWNQLFAGEIAEFCERQKARQFGEDAQAILWAVAISDLPIHFPDVIQRKLHFDFFSIYCDRPDDTLLVLGKMRSLHRNLSAVKKWLLCRDVEGMSDDHIAAEMAAKGVRTKTGRLVCTEDIPEAREWIAKLWATRRIPKSS